MFRPFAAFAVAAASCAWAAAAEAPKPADAPTTADKLVGTWKLSKTETPLPPGAVATLTVAKDGKFSMSFEFGGKKEEMTGTWKLDGMKLNVVHSTPDGKDKAETMEIKALTETQLVTVDDKGKRDEFTRAKAEKK